MFVEESIVVIKNVEILFLNKRKEFYKVHVEIWKTGILQNVQPKDWLRSVREKVLFDSD